MMMPGRGFSAGNSYRYGFNGKEYDNEVKGEGNEIDYGMRVYDPRVGRFLSFDPYFKEYNYLSPYHFAGDNPIRNLDKDGGEPKDYVENWQPRRIIDPKTGAEIHNPFTFRGPNLSWTDYEAVYDKVTDRVWFINHGNDGQYYYWKHNPGADQTRYITGAGKDNGMWVPFETKNKIAADKINGDHTNEYIFVGMIVIPVAALEYGGVLSDIMAAKSVVEKGNKVETVIESSEDAASQQSVPLDATKNRVKLRKGTIEKIKENQPRNHEGEMIDPNTKKPLRSNETDIGHKPGNEWRTRKQMHKQKGSTRRQVIEEENDPNLYQLEDRSSNRSHKFEKKG